MHHINMAADGSNRHYVFDIGFPEYHTNILSDRKKKTSANHIDVSLYSFYETFVKRVRFVDPGMVITQVIVSAGR